MYPSRVTGYQDPLSLKAFLHPSVSLSSSIGFHLQPVAKVKILIKLLMYVLSHGCLLSSYKVFFHLHTWFCLSCVSTPTAYKCLFESCLVSHNVSIYYMMELQTSLHVSILHPRHHSSWTDLPFLLGYFFISWSFSINDVIAFIILFFILNCRHLFFGTSLILLCL